MRRSNGKESADGVAYYSVVQYVPDATRNERINVGVVVTDEKGTIGHAKFLRDWSRARQFGREDVTFLRDFAQSLARELPGAQLAMITTAPQWGVGRLQRYSSEWRNSIQLQEPRASMQAAERLVEEMYEKLVKEPPPRRHAYRDRRAAASIARTAIRRAVQERFGQTQLVKSRDVWVKGKHDEHEFDVAIQNHSTVLVAKGLSFEGPPSDDLERDVDAVAWAIDDIRQGPERPKLSVIALPPIEANREYDRARKIYEALKADFVTADEAVDWAKATVGKMPPNGSDAKRLSDTQTVRRGR